MVKWSMQCMNKWMKKMGGHEEEDDEEEEDEEMNKLKEELKK